MYVNIHTVQTYIHTCMLIPCFVFVFLPKKKTLHSAERDFLRGNLRFSTWHQSSQLRGWDRERERARDRGKNLWSQKTRTLYISLFRSLREALNRFSGSDKSPFLFCSLKCEILRLFLRIQSSLSYEKPIANRSVAPCSINEILTFASPLPSARVTSSCSSNTALRLRLSDTEPQEAETFIKTGGVKLTPVQLLVTTVTTKL